MYGGTGAIGGNAVQSALLVCSEPEPWTLWARCHLSHEAGSILTAHLSFLCRHCHLRGKSSPDKGDQLIIIFLITKLTPLA